MISPFIATWCVLSPGALFSARQFIREHSGERHSVMRFALLLFALNIVIFYRPGSLMEHITQSAFFIFMAQLAYLDAYKHWLPLRFTTAFIVAGSLLAGSPGHLLAATVLWLPFFVMEHYPNGPGRGDKWLCAGLGLWLGFSLATLIIGISLLLILLTARILPVRGQPLAPYAFAASLLLLLL
ncbi:prepilin peptidase [Enterobacter asburiae]|uniref:prepilin peptidase n=1 Tax=Enterobacter asburiae TaxID=61645 RepID=UPI003F54E32E